MNMRFIDCKIKKEVAKLEIADHQVHGPSVVYGFQCSRGVLLSLLFFSVYVMKLTSTTINKFYTLKSARGLNIIVFFQMKKIVGDNFQVSSADDKYRIRVTFNSTDFRHRFVKGNFHYLNNQRFTTADNDNDNLERF